MRWKPIKRPANLIGYEVSDTGLIREIATKRPIHEYKSVKGYICVRKYNVEYKVHRIVADHFIRRVTRKLDVHHLDHNKSNPRADNLLVCTKAEHRRLHATTKKPVLSVPSPHGVIVLTEKTVHQICSQLEQGKSFPQIRESLQLYNITDDCIGKIAQGKNWPEISSQCKIKHTKRACMNMYSEDALVIAILMNRGYSVKQLKCSIFAIA